MALSRRQRRELDALAQRLAAEDPQLAQELSALPERPRGALGMRIGWTLL